MRTGNRMILALTVLAAGCSAAGKMEAATMVQTTGGEDGVKGLPSSFGKSFATLDEYIAHLRDYAGPIDLPWYREIKPGVYERVTSIHPAPPPQIFTRAELMKEYGFTR